MIEKKRMIKDNSLKCDTCQFGDRDVDCIPCRQCIEDSVYTLSFNTFYKQKEIVKYDFFIQWHAKIGKIIARGKNHLHKAKKKRPLHL